MPTLVSYKTACKPNSDMSAILLKEEVWLYILLFAVIMGAKIKSQISTPDHTGTTILAQSKHLQGQGHKQGHTK